MMMTRRKPVTDADIGALVRKRREAAGLSQAALGEVLGVTYQMVWKYEEGKTPLTVVKLAQIAEALDCKTYDLIPGRS
jgi:transcriptional regulator with XRE-family HTH domain